MTPIPTLNQLALAYQAHKQATETAKRRGFSTQTVLCNELLNPDLTDDQRAATLVAISWLGV